MKSETPKKIRVAVVAPSPRVVGGQSIQARRLVEAFAGDRQIDARLIPNNPELRRLKFLQKIPLVRTIATSLAFWRRLLSRIGGFEVVQVFSSGSTSYLISTLPALFAAKLFGKKTVLHYHTGEAEAHLRSWPLTARPTMKMFDRIVVPSRFLVDVFAAFDLPALSIPNFVETDKFVFRRRAPLRPVFLSNRNFEAHYNVGCVLRALRVIQETIPEARLIVAGAGIEEADLKRLAADLRLENVEFVGRVEPDEMPKIYDEADVYLNASVVDNMPLSFIEAFACGLPVVSSDAGGIPYLVEDGRTGMLVAPDDCRRLAEKALELLENQNLALEIAENARRECEKYEARPVREKWRAFYAEL